MHQSSLPHYLLVFHLFLFQHESFERLISNKVLMSLENYKKKRNFRESPEPNPEQASSKGALHFVVQEHHASHLHYDLRLELDGVLKSWAVPKGISMDPKVKRLAILVEDHPLAYQTFEGTIPPGNYGAGTVKIWDHGTYTDPEEASRHEVENRMREGLKKGHLRVVFKGSQLKGEFSIIRTNFGKKNSWLLIKKKDDDASSMDS